MKIMKIGEISKNLYIPHAGARKHALWFVGDDPVARQRSGHARELTAQEGFRVYLGGHLISQGFTAGESRRILDDLSPWMREKAILPGSPYSGDSARDKHARRFDVRIQRHEIGFSFVAAGHCGAEEIVEDGITFQREKRFLEVIPTTAEGPAYGLVRIVEIEILLGNFLFKMLPEDEAMKLWKARPGRISWSPGLEECVHPLSLAEAREQVRVGQAIAEIGKDEE